MGAGMGAVMAAGMDAALPVGTFARLLFGFLLQVVPFGILALYPFWDRLRVSRKKAAAIIVCAMLGLGSLFALAGCFLQRQLPGDATLFNAVNAVFLACLVPCFVMYLVLVRATWQEKLFVFSFALTCAWGITATVDIAFTVSHKNGPFDGLPYQGWTPILLLALGVVLVPLLMVLIKRGYLPVRDGITWKQGTVLALLAAAMFVMLASIFVMTAFTDAANQLTLALFAMVLVMVFAVYAAFLALLRIGNERLAALRQADRAEHMLQLQAQQIEGMEAMKRRDRRMWHDWRHALATLRGLVAQGAADAAIGFIDEYLGTMPSDSTTRYCGNEAVNSVVGYYAEAAGERGVAFSAKIALRDGLAASDAELCVVLGNLLDNAIAAASCGGEGARWVRLGVATSGDAVSIAVDNGFDGQVNLEGSRYLSTKDGHSGLGIESIEHLAQKRHGAAEFAHEGNVFHASVLLGCTTSEA